MNISEALHMAADAATVLSSLYTVGQELFKKKPETLEHNKKHAPKHPVTHKINHPHAGIHGGMQLAFA